MTAFAGVMDGAALEWEDPTTAATTPDHDGTRQSAGRARDPEGGKVERITLRLKPTDAADEAALVGVQGEAHLYGESSWTMATKLLNAWAAGIGREDDDTVEYLIRFRDAVTVTGRAHIRRRIERNLAAQVRRVSTFRASFCPNLSETEAVPLFRFFLGNYAVPTP